MKNLNKRYFQIRTWCIIIFLIVIFIPSNSFSSSKYKGSKYKKRTKYKVSNHKVSKYKGYEKFKGNTKYNKYFIEFTRKYFGNDFDWKYFKAQAIVESRLNPYAMSRTGAFGIMQIVSDTYKKIVQKDLIFQGKILKAKWNIAAGIYYDKMLWDLEIWKSKLSFEDRIKFMFGAYNSGIRNILLAQKLSRRWGLKPYVWSSVEKTLPHITGKWMSYQTINYVRKIDQITKVLQD